MQPKPATPPPGPGLRRGPRPLLLHLALASLKSSGSAAAWPSSNADWQSLIARISQSGPAGPLPGGPDAELIHGIAAYRRHPWVRDVVEPPVVWREGEARLLDYGGTGTAPPLLLVPSLVNRASILDLASGRSMARHLAASGLRVFMLDWGWPDAEARAMDLDALITGRLARAMAELGRVTLVGYCMGGLLALAAAQLQPERVAGLALLATPWDFHIGRDTAERRFAQLLELLEPVMQLTGTLPIDALQLLFSVGDPHGVGDKYRAFGAAPQDDPRAWQFVAIEDWLNDGVPLATPVARQCLRLWYGDNAPVRGLWQVAGTAIAPQTLRLPALVAVPARDRIVPPESAMPLATAIPGATLLRPTAGHVGMVAGASAQSGLWEPLAAWAKAVPSAAPGFPKRRRARKVVP
jgi:polyhydroxyalkanoate synthase